MLVVRIVPQALKYSHENARSEVPARNGAVGEAGRKAGNNPGNLGAVSGYSRSENEDRDIVFSAQPAGLEWVWGYANSKEAVAEPSRLTVSNMSYDIRTVNSKRGRIVQLIRPHLIRPKAPWFSPIPARVADVCL